MEEERKIWVLKLSWKYTTFNILDVQMWSIFIFTIILSPFCLDFIYFYFHIYLHICLFIYIFLGYSVHVELRGQLVGVTSLLSFWVPGIKLRASALVTSTLTNWAILLTQLFRLLIFKIILLCSLRHGNLGSLQWKSNRAVQDRGRAMSAFQSSAR